MGCAGTERGDRLEVQRVRRDRRRDGVPFVLADGRALRRGELRLGAPPVRRRAASGRLRVLRLRLRKARAGSRKRIPRAQHGMFRAVIPESKPYPPYIKSITL